jgi:hypothetical protein
MQWKKETSRKDRKGHEVMKKFSGEFTKSDQITNSDNCFYPVSLLAFASFA